MRSAGSPFTLTNGGIDLERQLQITFRGMDTSPAVEARITERVAKLEQIYDRLIGCHVVVEAPHQHSRQGNLFTVSAELRVPGGPPILAGKTHHEDQAHEDVYVAIRDTFAALERQLQDRVRKQRPQHS